MIENNSINKTFNITFIQCNSVVSNIYVKQHGTLYNYVDGNLTEVQEWPQDKADVECKEVITEIGGASSVNIATDGSYDPSNNRVGWRFVAYQNDVKLAEASGSYKMNTSSTRMELEAIRQAVLWLKETPPNCNSITSATGSMAVLTRIRKSWWLDSWHMDTMMVYAPGSPSCIFQAMWV